MRYNSSLADQDGGGISAMAHSTNYSNTFIEVAQDCPATAAEIPAARKHGGKSIALYHYSMLSERPYHYSSDELLFEVHVQRKDIPPANREAEHQRFFSKGQACMRSSPLGKRYGWGVHFDVEGKMAIYAVESDEYRALANDASLEHVRAMRSRRG
jgi:hypothetical protein